jgi:eukaryotic-like serine/threonine-protein kinase
VPTYYTEEFAHWLEEVCIVAALLEKGVTLRERYEIVHLVGQGGMGAVYQAKDLRLDGRVCALKEILPELLNGMTDPNQPLDQTIEQFYQEASVLARLDHPNLPKVSDYFSENGREYLVMDFVAGRDLHDILLESKQHNTLLSESQVLEWASQLLDALDYLHSQTPVVLHRDIKPSNIKVTPQGRVKLVDFGLVKVMQPDDTRTVTVVQGRGTVAYTPLEQYGGDTGHTDVRTDIYSTGATLYHLLAGHPPKDAKERFLQPGSLKHRTGHLSRPGYAPGRAPAGCAGVASAALWHNRLFGRCTDADAPTILGRSPAPEPTAHRRSRGVGCHRHAAQPARTTHRRNSNRRLSLRGAVGVAGQSWQVESGS